MPWHNLPAFSVGQVLTSASMNAMKDNMEMGHMIVTSTSRPASPDNGQMIFETDTLKVLVWTGASWDPIDGNPTGTILDYGGVSAPAGYLLCDGSAISRTTYSNLFSVISTTYGAGDGATTFQIPDFRGRVSAGTGTDGNVATQNVLLGGKSGDYRVPTHTHTFSGNTGYMSHNNPHEHAHEGPAGHSHGVWYGGVGGLVTFSFAPAAVWNGAYGAQGDTTTHTDINHYHAFSGTTSSGSLSGGAGLNVQPTLGVNKIIRI